MSDRTAEISAWKQVRDLWKTAKLRPPDTIYLPPKFKVAIVGTTTTEYASGLCATVRKLGFTGAVHLAMFKCIIAHQRKSHQSIGTYAWGFGIRGRNARIQFCQKQIDRLSRKGVK